jgi:DNA-binding MarR family transcriptional regulator
MPNFEFIERHAQRFPELDPEAMRTYLTVRKLVTRLDQAFDVHFARHHLSFGRFMVLVNLLRAEGHALAPAGLSEACGVTRATTTGLLDTLESAGHVAREPDPDDGRSFIVRLTPSGKRFILKMLPEHFTRITRMMSVLSHHEMRALRQSLEKLFGAAHEIEQTRSPRRTGSRHVRSRNRPEASR